MNVFPPFWINIPNNQPTEDRISSAQRANRKTTGTGRFRKHILYYNLLVTPFTHSWENWKLYQSYEEKILYQSYNRVNHANAHLTEVTCCVPHKRRVFLNIFSCYAYNLFITKGMFGKAIWSLISYIKLLAKIGEVFGYTSPAFKPDSLNATITTFCKS